MLKFKIPEEHKDDLTLQATLHVDYAGDLVLALNGVDIAYVGRLTGKLGRFYTEPPNELVRLGMKFMADGRIQIVEE